MTPERWRQLEGHYDTVKDLSPAERRGRPNDAAPYLSSAVEAIFAQEGSALEHPACEVYANLLQTVSVFSAGMVLGPYKIERKIGKGQEFDERFQREARAIASLSHRHICSLTTSAPTIWGRKPEAEKPQPTRNGTPRFRPSLATRQEFESRCGSSGLPASESSLRGISAYRKVRAFLARPSAR